MFAGLDRLHPIKIKINLNRLNFELELNSVLVVIYLPSVQFSSVQTRLQLIRGSPGRSLGSFGGGQPRLPMLTGSNGMQPLDGRRRDRGLGFMTFGTWHMLPSISMVD